jgi:hypothetical protein
MQVEEFGGGGAMIGHGFGGRTGPGTNWAVAQCAERRQGVEVSR